MGAVKLGKMSRSSIGPLRTAFIIAIVFICLIASILVSDGDNIFSRIFEDQGVVTEAQHQMAVESAAVNQATSFQNENTSVMASALSNNGNSKNAVEADKSTISNRPLILYAYADSEDGTALENFKFFIAHGLHAAADFMFILNGETKASSLIPKKENIQVIQRSNTCYDLGAIAEVLLKDDLYKRYKRFITMNASIRGPFVPYWSEGCWTDMFLNKITDEVKLVGITANCWPTFHIQSMIWATDQIGITTLLFPPPEALTYLSSLLIKLPPAKSSRKHPPPPGTIPIPFRYGINGCFNTYASAVAAEISSTSLILAAGYKTDAMMSAYHAMPDYEENRTCEKNGDVFWKGAYFGIDVHPFETVFIKANRDVKTGVLERYSEWMRARGYSSYDYCRA